MRFPDSLRARLPGAAFQSLREALARGRPIRVLRGRAGALPGDRASRARARGRRRRAGGVERRQRDRGRGVSFREDSLPFHRSDCRRDPDRFRTPRSAGQRRGGGRNRPPGSRRRPERARPGFQEFAREFSSGRAGHGGRALDRRLHPRVRPFRDGEAREVSGRSLLVRLREAPLRREVAGNRLSRLGAAARGLRARSGLGPDESTAVGAAEASEAVSRAALEARRSFCSPGPR